MRRHRRRLGSLSLDVLPERSRAHAEAALEELADMACVLCADLGGQRREAAVRIDQAPAQMLQPHLLPIRLRGLRELLQEQAIALPPADSHARRDLGAGTGAGEPLAHHADGATGVAADLRLGALRLEP